MRNVAIAALFLLFSAPAKAEIQRQGRDMTLINNRNLILTWDSDAVTGSGYQFIGDKDWTLAQSTNGTNSNAYWADLNGDYEWGAHINMDGQGDWAYVFGAHGADTAGMMGTTSVNSSTGIYIYHNNPTLNANQNLFAIRAATRWQDGLPQGAFNGDFVEFGSSGTATAATFRVPFDGGVIMGTSTARVGINNSSPQGWLHAGAGADAPSQGIGTSAIYAGNNGTTDIVVRDSTNDAELIFRAGSAGGTFGMTTNHALAFYTNLAARLNIQADGDAALDSSGSTAGRWLVSPPATETIAGAATITADGCGTVKRLQSTGNVTTNTTDTFTAPAAANTGCCMDVLNVDTVDTITLDANTNNMFAADIAMTPCDSIRVCSDGTDWYPVSALVANTCN